MPYAIETYALTKQFPKSQGWRGLLQKDYDPPAVDDVNLTVNQGELFGLVGPNGSGKTTLIKMLTTLVLPTSGFGVVNGYPLQDQYNIKRSVGLVTSDERSFFWRLTGIQNLEFFAALNQISRKEIPRRVAEVLELIGLEEVANKPFQTYSTGMRQRLSIARSFLSTPKLLFLDEPTKGLDPESTHQLLDFIHNRLSQSQGVTVFMASHRLEEVEQLCDRVAIMYQGKIRTCGSIEELRGLVHYKEKYRLKIQGYPSGENIEKKLAWIPDFRVESHEEDMHQVSFNEPEDEDFLGRVFDSIRDCGGKIREISRIEVSLESIFSEVTQQIPDERVSKTEKLTKKPIAYQTSVPSSGKANQIFDFLRVLRAFLVRDLRFEMSYRFSFFLQFFSVFFSVAVFYFIAQLFGGAAAPYLVAYGGDYFSFVLIGIAFAGYFDVGLSGFSSSLRQAQTTGTLEAMLSTPTSLSAIIINSSLWSYLMTTFRVVVYLLVGVLFLGVDLKESNFGAALLILGLTVISFSSLGILAASFIMVLKRGDPVTWIFGTTSYLLGGVYYPITVMPVWLQTLAYFLPVTYALRGMRMALLQDATISSLSTDILALLGFCIVLLPLSLAAFRFAVNRARTDGSLTYY